VAELLQPPLQGFIACGLTLGAGVFTPSVADGGQSQGMHHLAHTQQTLIDIGLSQGQWQKARPQPAQLRAHNLSFAYQAKSVLQDVEYKDLPKIKADEVYGDKANQSLLKELLKARKEIEFAAKPKVEQEVMKNEVDKKNSGSPIQAAHKGPVKGNPDPAGK
jgi:hypothetical protein